MTRQEEYETEQQIFKVTDKILAKLGKQSNGDVHVAIAALAVAMCSLARSEGMPIESLHEVISISHHNMELACGTEGTVQ